MMAPHINEDIRAEWEDIDFESDLTDYKRRKARAQNKLVNGIGNSSAKSKGNAKASTSPRRIAHQTRVRKDVYGNSSASQEHTGETQECITIESRPSIVPKDELKSVIDRRPKHKSWSSSAKQSVNHDRTKAAKQSSDEDSSGSTSFGWSDEGPTTKEADHGKGHKKSTSKLDQDLNSGRQETPSSIVETDDSPTGGEESDLDLTSAKATNAITLPYDSDDEELKAAEEKRIRAYTEARRPVGAKGLTEEEDSTQATKQTKDSLENPVVGVSSDIPTTYIDSQYSLTVAPNHSQQSNDKRDKQHSPIKGNLMPIPISSSTDVSQNMHSLGSPDVQIQHTPSQSRLPGDTKPRTPSGLGATPALPATSMKKQSPFKSPAMQEEESPGAALQRSAAAFSSPMRPSSFTQKHTRASRESSAEFQNTLRKRRRLESPIDLSPTRRDTAQSLSTASAFTPPPSSRHSKAAITIARSTPVRSTPKVVEYLSSNIEQRSPVVRHSERLAKNSTAKSKTYVVQKAQYILKDVDLDHDLPRMSSSQPIPDRPRIRLTRQAKELKPLPGPYTTLPELVQNIVVKHEVAESPEPETPEMELEPLTNIVLLQGADYCTAVKKDRVLGGLQRLYCEFLAEHHTYLGDMNHLFNLCAWLLRSRADPDEQGFIDEEFWDDFILQHQEGKYDAYVKRSLAKFRQPGTWSTWYALTEKDKSGYNVITAQRLEQILLGQELAAEKQRIPLLWSRFRHSKLASVS